MVNKKTGGISTLKSKLVAAIAMLLVGAFMVVSSSYAWFTLSTAPEVTGIYTSVGANGNLEMALVPEEGMASISSPVGSTGNNETWGNLVDLGQTEGNQNKYGLDLIQLMPARLNTKGASSTNYTYGFNGLQSVNYGADGRPNALVNAVAGKYDPDYKNFTKVADGAATYGVTAYGAASGMSAQQTAYLQYRKDMEMLLTSAQNKADESFETYGNALADVVMTKAMKGDGATFNIVFVPEMITALEAANQDILDAAEKYVAVAATIALYNLDDTTWSGVVEALATIDLSNVGADATTIDVANQSVPINSTLRDALNKYTSIKTKLDAAKAAVTASGLTFTDTVPEGDGETIPATAKATNWTNVNAILFTTGVLNYDEIQVNGKTTAEIRKMMGENFSMDNIPEELMNFGISFASNGVIDFTSGSGVHADIADIAGEYQAAIKVTLSLGGSSFTNENVRLRTKIDSGNKIDMTEGLSTPADNSAAGAVKFLTEYYGYQLDFAFRTNAKGSKLQLQTDATGRIYSTDGSDETMGHGSTMTFNILDNNFTEAQAKALMSTVRLVFMNEAGDIIGLGILDSANAVKGANNELTSAIYLHDFTIGADGVMNVVSNKKTTADLMDLQQNTATKLSVLVYMDGDLVDNSMVAAEAVASLQGSLNLQFSSSADLKPMEYTEFKGTSNNTTTEAATEAATEAQG